MKAVIYREYGGPEVLEIEDAKKPIPNETEVLIRVYAATVNRTDCANLTAKPFIMRFGLGLLKPNNPILGTDFAGVVEEIGSTVSKFKVGDRVFGFHDGGLSSYAEYMTFPENDAICKIPAGISFEQAAASCEGAHYAYNTINKVDDLKGRNVLIHGATGAIGSAGVQLCKHFGADVTGTCGTGNEKSVLNLGADRVINWQERELSEIPERFHFVFDMVGKSEFGVCKKILKPKGIYISSELGPNLENIPLSLFHKQVRFPFPTDRPRTINMMAELLAEKKFLPLIDREYEMDNVAEAFSYVLTGQKIGNVILKIFGD